MDSEKKVTRPDAPAFPHPSVPPMTGFTKREEIATQIMAGLVTGIYTAHESGSGWLGKKTVHTAVMSDDDLATNAVSMADALIRALNDPTKHRE